MCCSTKSSQVLEAASRVARKHAREVIAAWVYAVLVDRGNAVFLRDGISASLFGLLPRSVSTPFSPRVIGQQSSETYGYALETRSMAAASASDRAGSSAGQTSRSPTICERCCCLVALNCLFHAWMIPRHLPIQSS